MLLVPLFLAAAFASAAGTATVSFVNADSGKETARGEEWLSDFDYLRGLSGRIGVEALHDEKRMLDAWFKERFVDGAAAPG